MSLNLDGVGFADVKKYQRIEGGLSPLEIFPKAKTAIVYLFQLEKLTKEYGHWYVVSLNNFVSSTNKKLIEFLASKRYMAVGINENEYDRKTLVGKVSFRQLAVLAGLGSIGLNQMLLTPKFGPRIVIGAVFTDASIKPDQPFWEDLCTQYGICKNGCPTGAIDKTFSRFKCKNRRKILGTGCGIPCVDLCPIGK
jgi:epoxyqueuosine reductase